MSQIVPETEQVASEAAGPKEAWASEAASGERANQASQVVGAEKDLVATKFGSANGTTYLADLPRDIADVLQVFDFDNDGTIDRSELCQAVRAYQESRAQQKFWRKMFLITFAAFLVLIACIGGLVWGISVALKDNKTEDGKLKDNSGRTLQTDVEMSSVNLANNFDPLFDMTTGQLRRLVSVPYIDTDGTVWDYKPMNFAMSADRKRLLVQVEENAGIVAEKNKQPKLVSTNSVDWKTTPLVDRSATTRQLWGFGGNECCSTAAFGFSRFRNNGQLENLVIAINPPKF